jgi:glutathione peroxidase
MKATVRIMRWIFSAALAMAAIATQTPGRAQAVDQSGSAFDHDFTAIDGSPMPLGAFRGKVMLVVNTASFCGFTNQYKGLQDLWETYGARGLVVIGVPSNDFHQETKSESEIAQFCQGAFGVTFPLTAKVRVIGADAHPFYRWAHSVVGSAGAVRWNFHKFLISRDGNIVAWFPTRMEPTDTRIRQAIENELQREAGG